MNCIQGFSVPWLNSRGEGQPSRDQDCATAWTRSVERRMHIESQRYGMYTIEILKALHARICVVFWPLRHCLSFNSHIGIHTHAHLWETYVHSVPVPSACCVLFSTFSGMKSSMREVSSLRICPSIVGTTVLRHVSPPELARAAAVNKSCYSESDDQRLWSSHFLQEWSPECCVSSHLPRSVTCYDAVFLLHLHA
jgi:hypothetical protein